MSLEHLPQFPLRSRKETGENEAGRDRSESELSPEKIEAIMTKIQDVNADGTAFTWIRSLSASYSGTPSRDTIIAEKLDRLKDILQDGLLGMPRDQIFPGAYETSQARKTRWSKNTRQRNLGGVYFNVIGQSTPELNDAPIRTIRDTKEYREYGMGLTFDLSKLNPDEESTRYHGVPQKSRMYKADKAIGTYNRYYEKFGFVAAGRIPPRILRGVIIDTADINPCEVALKQQETFEEKQGTLLPIYDLDGNLLWPRKLNYEQVKELVAEREKQKENS